MGRLDAQKGVDVLFEAVDSVLKGGADAQFIFMGSGIEELEEVYSRSPSFLALSCAF
jgi:glycogen synthase